MVIYNLPPWLCMKRKFMMLSIFISGPKQPRDDIGIYLEPLIDDLKLLWESGVQCYDAYNEELFNLRTVLLWTINDFPAYGNLSGCSVKGYKACPICEDNTSSIRLKYGKKWHTLGIENFYHIIILFVVKRNRLMVSEEVEVTSEPSNLPIQLKYILRYAERVMVDGSSFSFQLPLELFGISRKSYVLREDVIDFCNMQKVKTLSMVAYITYHWSLVIINPYDDVVYHLDSLRTSSRDDIKYVTNMALTIFQSQNNLKKTRKTTFWKAVKVRTVECGYYVMRYMREIVSKDTSIITDAIDTRNSYSQLELDEVRVE
ncbi:hypothetical protein IC582_021428 [Cucumis melo]